MPIFISQKNKCKKKHDHSFGGKRKFYVCRLFLDFGHEGICEKCGGTKNGKRELLMSFQVDQLGIQTPQTQQIPGHFCRERSLIAASKPDSLPLSNRVTRGGIP